MDWWLVPSQLVIMGGDLHSNHLDLNFLIDRDAANIVLESSVPKLLVTLQACIQVMFTDNHIRHLIDRCCPTPGPIVPTPNHNPAICGLADRIRYQAKMMQRFMLPYFARDGDVLYPVTPELIRHPGIIPWDVIALLAVSHPHIFKPHRNLTDVRIEKWRMRWSIDESDSFDLRMPHHVQIVGNITTDSDGVASIIIDLLCHPSLMKASTIVLEVPWWLTAGLYLEIGALISVACATGFIRKYFRFYANR